MKTIGLFYGTTSGRTQGVADEIEFNLGSDVEVHNVADGIEAVSSYENLILALPTYGVGELQQDWCNKFDAFKKLDLTGKVVALVGIGNQTTFGESFLGGLKLLYEAVVAQGGRVVGLTSTDGYHFEECDAIVDNQFMGLALDEDNQDDMTPDRIYDWLEDIKPEFN